MNPITYNHYPNHDPSLPINFFTAHSNYPQENIYRPKGTLAFHQILIVVSGTGILKCCNQTYELKRGCAFFTSKTQPVEYINTKDLVTAFLTATGSAIDDLMAFYHCNGFLFYESVNVPEYISDINNIIHCCNEHKPTGLLSALTYTFYTNYFELQNNTSSDMDQIILYIEKNFTKKLTLTQLAEIGPMSVSKLCHDFKSKYHLSVFKYILSLRLTYARTLLISNPRITTKEIAVSSGFEDVSYFCRSYKAKFGITVSEDKERFFL